MNVRDNLEALLSLQEIDSALDTAKRKYAALDKGLQVRQEYESAKGVLGSAEQLVKQTEMELKDAQLECKGVVDRHKLEYAKLYSGKVTGSRELQDLQAEVEMLERNSHKLKEKVDDLARQLENQRSRALELRQDATRAGNALRRHLEGFNKIAAILRDEAATLSASRAEAAAKTPSDLLGRYESLRTARGGVAIVMMQEGEVCSGCRMRLSASLKQRVNACTDIVLCENCERIICPQPK